MPIEPSELILADAAEWRRWLAEHHDTAAEAWLVLARKGTTGPTTLSHDQALDEALCQGWIDGQVHGRDPGTFYQRFTPRRAGSTWSKRNVEHVARLLAQRRMCPAGLAEVERAKADGRWAAAYAGPATVEVPTDLLDALAAVPRAQAMFDILTSQNRYAILLRLHGAKREETRARRIQGFIEMLARGETIYPQRRALDDDTPWGD
jgi:uncharacterized protein YdeI (YjbR/CyaY-like superfamily)